MKRLIIIFILAFLINSSHAGEFRVSPIRVEIDNQNKSHLISVYNEGQDPIEFKLYLMEWYQDDEGNDKYKPSQDLIFFPKVFRLDKEEERVVRVGLTKPFLEQREKAYRLYIEEQPKKVGDEGTKVAIAIRFGLPIFVKPEKPYADVVIEKISYEKEQLKIHLTTVGNVHTHPNNIKIIALDKGKKEVYSQEINGWYIFPAVKKTFSTKFAKNDCERSALLEIHVQLDGKIVEKTTDINPEFCNF